MDSSALGAIFNFIFENVQYILAVILLFCLLVYYEQHQFRFSFKGQRTFNLGEFLHSRLPFLKPFLQTKKLETEDKTYHALNPTLDKSVPEQAHSELEDTLKNTASQTRLDLEKYEKGLEHELDVFVDTSKHTFQDETLRLEQELKNINSLFSSYLNKLGGESQLSAQEVRSHIEQSQKNFSKFLTDLSTKSQTLQIANQEESKKRIDAVFRGIEDKISENLIQNEQKMMMSIDLELRSARQLIDTYKVQQLSIIDENIVAMLEKTLSLVLSKKLNLRDQMNLIYEALEKAKVEKFIV